VRGKITPLFITAIFVTLTVILLGACASPAADEDDGPPAEADPEAPDEIIGAGEVGEAGTLTIYSGRNEELVGPLIEQFEEETGIDVRVRYGDTAALAATILEEGENSPADVYYGQDAGALGALSNSGLVAVLPADVLDKVDPRFASPDGLWVGTSGRARVVVYNTDTLTEDDLPDSILDFTGEEWEGRIGWAPTNGSFQSFVTALRVLEGEGTAQDWLEAIAENDVTVYPNNTTIVEAVANGEVEVGFVNHYYLFRQLAENPDFPAANYFLPGTDVGNLINVAGVAALENAANKDNAMRFTEYLLSEEAQEYFRDETFEYPLASGVEPFEGLPPLDTINTPDIDLSNLEDLEGTIILLQDTGVLE